ncbi:MAG: efflux RND transporter periplasmic adaptor subunit [Flavobacteriaceae bacterium]
MKLKHIIIPILLLALTSLIIYRIIANKEPLQTTRQLQPAKVDGIIIKTQYFEDILSLSGSLEADEQVEIRSEVSGIVQRINFKEGSQVQKGQILLKINDVELQAQLLQAKTKEQLASENARRAELLLDKEAISREEFDIISAEYQSAKAQTQLIEAQIAKTVIVAPFSGKIGLRNISEGTYVTPITLIAKLVSSSDMKITFSVPEKYANQISINTELKFTVSGSNEKFAAKVYAIEPEIELATRTLKVRAKITNKEGKLLPGSFADVELPLSVIDDAIIIPTESVIPIQDGKMVFVKQNGKAKDVKIVTSTRTEKDILILEGLKAGDTLITSGIMSLKPNVPIMVNVK